MPGTLWPFWQGGHPAEAPWRCAQIRLAYYLQMWFRYYLQQHIESSMSEIETKEGIYSLDFHRQAGNSGDDGRATNAMGAVGNAGGKWWTAAEVPGTHKVQFSGPVGDLSHMNLEWVANTADPIFSDPPPPGTVVPGCWVFVQLS